MNIVIVDDEQIIVTWLKKNIETLSSDYCVVKTCSNGQQALEYCLENPVDLLFTDIRMPVMDGISMLNSLKSHKRMPYTILLTAYDDFDYARQALQLGAREFLLKTEISEESLRQSLDTAFKSLKSSGQQKSDPIYDMLNELIHTDKEVDATKWQSIFGQSLLIILLETKDEQDVSRSFDILNFVYSEEGIVPYTLPLNEGAIALFSGLPFRKDFVKKCRDTLQSFGLENCYIASAFGEKTYDLSAIYKEAMEQLRLLLYYQIQESSEPTQEELCLLSDVEQEISTFIRIENYRSILNRVHDWLELIGNTHPPLLQVHCVAMRFLLQIYWEKIPEAQRKTIAVDRIVRIIETQRFSMFRNAFVERIEDLLSLLPDYEKDISPVVANTILYIKTNYTKPLTLDDIAEAVHLNRSYLSTVFKKEIGVNLFEYLQQYRLELSKGLLVQKKLSIGQVGEQVGLPDAAYFSKLFKKYQGVTPHDYRKQQFDFEE